MLSGFPLQLIDQTWPSHLGLWRPRQMDGISRHRIGPVVDGWIIVATTPAHKMWE